MAVGGLFVEVGMMLVEGRMSSEVTPGPPRPGPHCPPFILPSSSTHVCTESNHLCVKAEGLKRHMFLLSESRVPMCIDVYLCADCACGRARAAASQPTVSDILLEQWTVAFNKTGQGMEVDGKGLLAAIRSQLHFSQLSAWYSRHGVSAIPPVCYRLGHPAPALPAQSVFHRPPVEHVFPTVRVNSNLFLQVTMKSLPRLDCIPEVSCPIHGSRRTISSVNTVVDRITSSSVIQSPSQSQRVVTPPPLNLHSHPRPHTQSVRSSVKPIIQQSSSNLRMTASAVCSQPGHKDVERGSSIPLTHQAQVKANQASPSGPTASQAAQATITAFRTVFAELGHCLLDPPSRIPPLKQGFFAWRERRSQAVHSNIQRNTDRPGRVSSSPHRSSTNLPNNSTSSSRKSSSFGMVDDRMQCGCKHIGKHHCEEPIDTENESNSTTTNGQHSNRQHINTVCDTKERRKSNSSPPPSHCCNDLHEAAIRPPQHNSPNHCCRERELNRANALHGINPLGGSNYAEHDHTDNLLSNRNSSAPLIILTPAQPNPLKRKRQQEGTNSKKLSAARPETDHIHQAFSSQQLVDIFRRLDIRSTDHPTAEKQVKENNSKEDGGVLLGSVRSVCSSLGSSPIATSPLTTPSSLATSPITPSPIATSPLLSSSSPIKKCGWTDSSSEDTESESPSKVSSCSIASNQISPIKYSPRKSGFFPKATVSRVRCGPLLGSLEECLLKRRLKPERVISQGYTADLGASGAFCPKHLSLPVTVEFYSPMGLASPLLGYTSVGKKGYSVPRSGTIQATLLNPHGTVVKMFVVPYDLEDMPSNSSTFLRQRITSTYQEASCPLLRYLIHLRFSSSKSGRIYLDGEIWMLVCRQYDADATLGLDPLETNSHLNAVVVAPDNPKYFTRK